MAAIGALTIPVSADIKGLQKGLKDAQKEIKAFGKTLGRIEGMGIGGILGALAGGGIGGFVLGKLDDAVGLTDKIKEVFKELGQGAFDKFAGVNSKELAAQEERLAKELEGTKTFQKREQAMKLELVRMKEGEDAAFRLQLQQEGRNAIEIKILELMRQQTKEFRDQEKAAAEVAAINKRRGDILFDLHTRAVDAGIDDPIELELRRLRRQGLNEKDLEFARKDLEKIRDMDARRDAVRQVVDGLWFNPKNFGGMFGEEKKAFDALAPMLKGSRDEFSALNKLRRGLQAADKDADKQMLEIEKKQLDAQRKIQKAVENPPIKQVKM